MALIKSKTVSGTARVPVYGLEFTVHFKPLNREARLRAAADIDAKDEDTPILAHFVEAAQKTKQLLRENVTGWDGLTGEGGATVDYSPEVLDEMLEEDAYFDAIQSAFFSANSRESAEKN